MLYYETFIVEVTDNNDYMRFIRHNVTGDFIRDITAMCKIALENDEISDYTITAIKKGGKHGKLG